MKKLVSLLLIAVLSLTIISPVSAETEIKISKSKAVLEVDALLKLKISGTDNKITWSTSKKSVATVSSAGTVTAKGEGEVVITAIAGNVKYTCKVTIVDSNKGKTVPSISITSASDFEDYLNDTYPSINTAMGKINLSHHISVNDLDFFAYDFFITTDWDGVEPYDIEYSISYSDSEKEDAKNKLRKLQENIYSDFVRFFPDKKATGGYLHSWYKYPTIQVGYESRRFLSWCNYEESNDAHSHNTSKIGNFRWTPLIDDYNFTE